MRALTARQGRCLTIAGTLLLALLADPFAASGGPLVNGDVLVTDPSGIVSVDPSSGATSLFSPINALDVDSGAGAVYATSGNSVLRIDPRTGVATTVSSGGFLSSLQGPLAVARNGDVFVITRPPFGFTQLVRISGSTGEQTLLFTDPGPGFFFIDVSVGPDGKVFVGTQFGFLYKVDPDTGAAQSLGDIDHTKALDADSDGALAVVHSFHLNYAGIEFPFCCDGAIGWDGSGPSDITWGLHKDVFFTSDLGLFHLEGSPIPALTNISTDLHGRLTLFIPNPGSLVFLLLGIAFAIGTERFAKSRFARPGPIQPQARPQRGR